MLTRGPPGDPPDRRAVELAGMDIVEVSPPYDHAEVTAAAANRCALEAISALAVRKAAGHEVRFRARSGSGAPRRAPCPAAGGIGHGRPAGDPGSPRRPRRSIWP